MTAVTTGQVTGARPAPRGRAGLADTVRSEFTKIRSVRSTYWSLILFLLASVGWSVAFCAIQTAHWAHMSAADRSGFDPTQSSVLGASLLGQLVIVVLGALVITSEYTTGMIRTSLTVMPRREVLYAAKASVFTLVSLLIAVPASFLSFFVGQWLLAGTHSAAALSQPKVLPAVLMSGLYAALCGLLGFGLGAVLRSTAGAISAGFGLLFLMPELARALPASLYADLERWLPGPFMVAEITNTQAQPINAHLFSAGGELGVFALYAAVMIICGAVALRVRDA